MWIYLYKTVYDGMRWYAMVCDGMRWYAMVCNQRMQWDATAYNGMQRHTIGCGIFTT